LQSASDLQEEFGSVLDFKLWTVPGAPVSEPLPDSAHPADSATKNAANDPKSAILIVDFVFIFPPHVVFLYQRCALFGPEKRPQV